MASKRPGSRSIDSYFQKTSTATSQTDGEDPKRKRLTESDVTSSDSVESVDPDKSLKHGSSARPAESNLVSTAAQVPFPEYVDIASTQFRNTDDEIKLSILCENSKHPNVWQKFTFPSHNIDGKQRKVNYQILERYPWMRYSISNDSVYCGVCCMFSNEGQGDVFCKGKGMNDWKNLSTCISRHLSMKSSHHGFVVDATNFVRVRTGGADILSELDKLRKEKIQRNRYILKEIIEVLILCGKQNIPVRGHTEEDSNFKAILERVAASNTVLLDHLKNASRNATYISPAIQNEIIDLCGKRVRNALVEECNAAQCFSLLADEATDSATIEQVSISVRYVHHKDTGDIQVKEEFLGFKEAPGRTTAAVIADLLLNSLKEYKVNTNTLRGQGYDGAANMAGIRNGVQAKVKEAHPNAIYVHCQSHALNLSIVHSCQDRIVRNMMSTVQEIAFAFSFSAKRQHQFQEKLKETPESQEQMGRRAKLRTLCETRWGARADALCTFKSSFDVILKALEVLDTIQDSKARGFINSMLKFEFIIALIASEWLLQFIVPLTNYLQTVDLDLLQAHAQANVVIQSLRNERKDESWNKLHEMAVSLAVKHDVAVCKPRLAGRQLFRENVPADSVSEYYKLAMYYPFLDHLISELDSRLIKPSPLFKVTNLLPKNVGNWSPAEISAKEILDAYDPDIPEDIQQLHESECLRWKLRWDKVDNPPATIVETLPHCRPQEFPNLSRAFTALLTLPITTATAERSFSALRRLKTYLRSTMKEDRLSGLALMHIHKHDVSLNAEDIVDDFAASGNRRIELLF
ncbi:52 kDa repressor of the inhibitor of the protein kinase-like [Oculina patagonica]